MGRVGTEAKGIVRRELASTYGGSERAVANRVAELCENATGCFDRGRRLSAKELADLAKAVRDLPMVSASSLGRTFYIQPHKANITNVGRDFDEEFLEVRALELLATRRALRFYDYTLGAEFTAHFLGRLVERGGVKEDLAGSLLRNSIAASGHFAMMRLGLGRVSSFGIPFGDGLVFGQFLALDGIVPCAEFEADARVVGFREPTMKTIWSNGGPTIGLRIATFVSGPELNDSQDRLLAAWRNFEARHKDVWPFLGLAALVPEKKNTEQLIAAMPLMVSDFRELIGMPEWPQ